jgi:hypothetical protein
MTLDSTTITGNVYLVQNKVTAESYAFAKEQQLQADGNPINVKRSAGPFTADWDGDGDLDLLVGADDGSVSLYSNTGSSKSPELASAIQLVPPVEKSSSRQPHSEVRRGSRSKICVTDWNEDGLLDLLVGDFSFRSLIFQSSQTSRSLNTHDCERSWRKSKSNIERCQKNCTEGIRSRQKNKSNNSKKSIRKFAIAGQSFVRNCRLSSNAMAGFGFS